MELGPIIFKPWRVAARSVLCAGLALTLWGSARGDAAKSFPEISSLYYDFEVAGYCGLVTHRVGRGFQQRAAQLIAQHGLDQQTIERVRGAAWQAAHKEWQNRGLGGFKNWCRTEGQAAAEGLARLLDGAP